MRMFENDDQKLQRVEAQLRDAVSRSSLNILQQWNFVDENQRGSLDYDSFGRLVGMYDRTINQGEIKLLFAKLDDEKKERVTKMSFMSEFGGSSIDPYSESKAMRLLADIKEKLQAMTKADALRLFNYIDRSGDGNIVMSEFEEFVKGADPRIEIGDIINMFRCIDTDKNKAITFDEFSKAIAPRG